MNQDNQPTRRVMAAQITEEGLARIPVGAGTSTKAENVKSPTTLNARALAIGLGIFVVTLLPRLYVLFFVTDPQNPGLGWYGDTFHHWQIAYLSKEIGFHQGFLRLWDFKGLEYFWGLLHPLLLTTLFTVTGSVNIIIPRLVSSVGAAVSLALLFFLLRRYFNWHVALAGVLLAAFNPVGIFSDSIGMQEPLGLSLLFLGLLLWPRSPFWVGVLFALAGMVRAEYWLFSSGLIAVAMFSKEKVDRLLLALGWGLPCLAYMKYLLDYTGNPIYPIYWNFLGNAAGAWMQEAALTPDRMWAQGIARVVLVIAALAAAWIVWKRPKFYLLLLLGLGNIIFLGLMWGFSSYIHGFIPRFIYDRLLVVPYMYLGIFLALGLLELLPRLPPARPLWLSVGWVTVIAVLALSQIAWPQILGYYQPLNEVWSTEKQMAQEIADVYSGGAIAIPEDRPGLVYALVEYHKLSAQHLQGEMFDPFYYFTGDPFADWGTSWPVVQNWLTKNDIRLLVFYGSKGNYTKMIERQPESFRYIKTVNRGTIQVYEVIGP